MIGALLGKWFGDPSKSMEDMELPEGFSFIKSMTVMTSLIMFVIFLVMGFIMGVPRAADTFTGGVVWLWFLWIVMQSVLFGGPGDPAHWSAFDVSGDYPSLQRDCKEGCP